MPLRRRSWLPQQRRCTLNKADCPKSIKRHRTSELKKSLRKVDFSNSIKSIIALDQPVVWRRFRSPDEQAIQGTEVRVLQREGFCYGRPYLRQGILPSF